MITISVLWLSAGLMVLYNLGINDVMASIGMEAVSAGNSEEMDNPLIFALCMFLLVMLWPIVWFEYLKENR